MKAFCGFLQVCVLLFGISFQKIHAAPQDDFSTGRKAFLAGDVVGAMPALKRAADAGHAEAQSLYGYILDKSEENESAAKYFRAAAEQGNADGQYGLGALYAAGEGVARDPAAAREWLERAAGQGHAQAVMALSQAFFAQKLGFRRDPADAAGLAWVRKAAELDSMNALDYLAKGYRSGAFGAIDLAQAERMEARLRELSPERKKGRGRK
jgi:TPR repeat protein